MRIVWTSRDRRVWIERADLAGGVRRYVVFVDSGDTTDIVHSSSGYAGALSEALACVRYHG